MPNRTSVALRHTLLTVLSAISLAGCVSNAAPGSTEAYATSIQATALAGGIASSVDPTGLGSAAAGMAFRAQQQARMAQTIGSTTVSIDPAAELARAKAYQRALQEGQANSSNNPSE